jgi:hypothetical protein
MAKSKSKNKKNSSAEFMKFWSEHPNYSAFVHITLGLGLGLLGESFLSGGYVNTVGWFLVFVAVICHVYPLVV